MNPMAKPAPAADILVVDDTPANLNLLCGMLKGRGYKTRPVPSGQLALQAARADVPDLILLDISMPDMDGFEVCEALKADPRLQEVPVIFISAKTDTLDKVRAFALGGVDYVTKPFQFEEVYARVATHLEIRRQQRELNAWNQTLEKKVEERTRELREAEAQMVHAEKMASLGILTGGVAHELNNPLGGIIGISQLLILNQPEDEQLGQDLRTICKAAIHCSEIVKNLLRFARKSPAELREPVDFSDIVSDVSLLIGHLFHTKNIELRREFPPDFPRLLVNPPQMRQVLLNLLVNSQQAMTHAGVVTVRGRRDEAGDLVVEVEDQGPGVPPEIADKIFDPFFTTKPEGEGTGIGLSVTSKIVFEHGGRIEVEPGKSDGACIRMTFPASLAFVPAPPESQTTEEKLTGRQEA